MNENRYRLRAGRGALTLVVGAALLASACGTQGAAPKPSSTSSASVAAVTTRAPAPSPDRSRATGEAAQRTPRLAVTYDGGVLVLDALTMKPLADFPLAGFTRLNQAGDGRHLLVTEGQTFRALDLGTWSEPHGDHDHRYTTDPMLTDIVFESDKPGHAVAHGDTIALYGDGNGVVEWFDPAGLAKGKPKTHQWDNKSPHHGVAVIREDDTMITTIGSDHDRSGIRILDPKQKEITRNTSCPGTHGEAVAEDETIVIGCEDGILIVKGTQITKVDSPDDYGRIGNQAGSEESPVVLGDYKVDEDAELERPKRITLTDTRTGSLALVDLPASYSFRSLGRGPSGEGLLLGTDGTLRVIDVEKATIAAEIPVTKAWEEPMEWQDPRPTLFVQGGTAYVTEPASRMLHAVDLDSRRVVRSVQLPRVPNELNGVTG